MHLGVLVLHAYVDKGGLFLLVQSMGYGKSEMVTVSKIKPKLARWLLGIFGMWFVCELVGLIFILMSWFASL